MEDELILDEEACSEALEACRAKAKETPYDAELVITGADVLLREIRFTQADIVDRRLFEKRISEAFHRMQKKLTGQLPAIQEKLVYRMELHPEDLEEMKAETDRILGKGFSRCVQIYLQGKARKLLSRTDIDLLADTVRMSARLCRRAGDRAGYAAYYRAVYPLLAEQDADAVKGPASEMHLMRYYGAFDCNLESTYYEMRDDAQRAVFFRAAGARDWLRSSRIDFEASMRMGLYYYEGKYVPNDTRQAELWLRMAKNQLAAAPASCYSPHRSFESTIQELYGITGLNI